MLDDDGTNAEHIGTFETTLAAIMGSRAQTLQADLVQESAHNTRGKIIIRADAIQDSNLEYHLSFTWKDAGNIESGCCGSSIAAVWFQFYRKMGDGWIKTFTSLQAKDPATPESGMIKISL